MTIDEMIEQLEMFREDWGGDLEVRLATQPNYPLQSSVARLALPEADADGDLVAPPALYILEGRQCDRPYAPEGLFNR